MWSCGGLKLVCIWYFAYVHNEEIWRKLGSSICEKFYEFYESESHPLAAADFPAAPQRGRTGARTGTWTCWALVEASALSSQNAEREKNKKRKTTSSPIAAGTKTTIIATDRQQDP